MVNNKFGEKQGYYPISTVTLRTVDQAVSDYYSKKLSLTVDNGDGARVQVPVMFAGPERWKAMQYDTGIRSENGTLILPLISIRRTNITREKNFGGMASEQPYITVKKDLSPKTLQYQRLFTQRVANGFPQPKGSQNAYTYLTLPFPDFCIIYYEIIAWAQYQNQMNEIIETLVYNYDYQDSFVMPVDYEKERTGQKGYYFVGFMDEEFSSESNFEEMTDNERVIKYLFNIRVPVYLVLSPESEATAYGRDKGNKNSTNAPVVYQQQGASTIVITETVGLPPQQEDSNNNNNNSNVKIIMKS